MGRSKTAVLRGTQVAGARTVKHGVSHLSPYIAPWVAWLALPVFGTVTHAFASASGTPSAVAVGALVAIGAIYQVGHTWQVFTPRGPSVRNQATASVGLAALWLLWVTAVGLWRTPVWHWLHPLNWLASMFNGWPWGAWVLVGGTVAIGWNIRRGARGEGTDGVRGDGSDGLLDKLKIAGEIKPAQIDDVGRVRARIKVEPGEHTIADLQTPEAQASIASFAQIRRGGVRVRENPENPVDGEIILTPHDPLKDKLPWPGPSALGASIAETPVTVGKDEDGDLRGLWLPGDPVVGRNLAHIGVGGMSGAGKTETVLPVVTDALTRRDVSVIASDHVKAGQTIRPIAQAFGLYADNRTTATRMFKRLPAAIEARTRRLGEFGFKQWVEAAAAPPCNLKFLIYWVEEASALLANSHMFVQVTEAARSAGILLLISQQRWTYDRIPTSARENMGAGWCFGIKDEENAGYILDERTLDAGVKPWLWKNGNPGYCVLEHPSIPVEKWSVPMRGWIDEDAELLRQAAAEAVGRYGVNQLDATTAAAFGDVYKEYVQQVNQGAAGWQQGARPDATVIPIGVHMAGQRPEEADDEVDPVVDGEDEDEDDETFDQAVADDQLVDEPDAPVDIPDDPDPELEDDPNALDGPEDDVPDLEFDVPPPAPTGMSRSAALAALRTFLQKMAEAGHETVTPAQLVEVRQKVGRSRSWLTGALGVMATEGLVVPRPDKGVYGLARKRAA